MNDFEFDRDNVIRTLGWFFRIVFYFCLIALGGSFFGTTKTVYIEVPVEVIKEVPVHTEKIVEVDVNSGLKRVAELRGQQVGVCLELIRSNNTLLNSNYNQRILALQAEENIIITQYQFPY